MQVLQYMHRVRILTYRKLSGTCKRWPWGLELKACISIGRSMYIDNVQSFPWHVGFWAIQRWDGFIQGLLFQVQIVQHTMYVYIKYGGQLEQSVDHISWNVYYKFSRNLKDTWTIFLDNDWTFTKDQCDYSCNSSHSIDCLSTCNDLYPTYHKYQRSYSSILHTLSTMSVIQLTLRSSKDDNLLVAKAHQEAQWIFFWSLNTIRLL
jgi:hypothetical protein